MQLTDTPSWDSMDYDAARYTASTPSRRIRHITSIQIRNLTPFPARDALASALTKPSEQPQFMPFGHLSDDLDVTLGRKRGRRISAASSMHSGPKADEEGISGTSNRSGMSTVRRRTSSRASIPLSTSAGSSSSMLARHLSNAGTVNPARPDHRPRTLSMASSHSHHAPSSSFLLSSDVPPSTSTSTSTIFSDLLRDTSQKVLERILQSRLVETFLTVTLLPSGSRGRAPPSTLNGEYADPSEAPPSLSSPFRPAKDRSSLKTVGTPKSRRGTIGFPVRVTPSHSSTVSARHTSSPSTPSVKGLFGSHGKSASVSSSKGRTSQSPSRTSPQKTRLPPSAPSSPSPSKPADSHARSSVLYQSVDQQPTVPDYISPIHWPSTNPVFHLSRYEFAPGTDLSGSSIRVDVWGHTGQSASGPPHSKKEAQDKSFDGKGKGKERQVEEDGHSQWKILQSWEAVLSDLQPLPDDLATHPAQIPFNTLLVTMSSGETLYLPSRNLLSARSRSPSPDGGYNSDPEAEAHRVRGVGNIGLQSPKLGGGGLDSIHTSPAISDMGRPSLWRKRVSKSASWQDILKIINLQTVIPDTQESLGEVVRQIDKVVIHNEVNILAREISEREASVTELKEERLRVLRGSEALRKRIMARREDLRRRRGVLAHARKLHERDLQEESWTEETISEERARLSSLRCLLPIMRSHLISAVSFIYPIELVSSPDLMFSILNVPLPIPVAATDPAPPISLPTFKDVTEESVATALGYSAQAVHLLAAYMGHRLVYPVTCVGSRSMIKDGISAMVGPRNFPLFSKAVDTYRFEYGVFLLNKDIEMLMLERNLRALDMRHTLPNLKNLLLTLTDHEPRSIPGHRVGSWSMSISSLQSQSPIPATSSLHAEPTAGPDIGGQDGGKPDGSPDALASMSASEHGTTGGAGTSTSWSSNVTPPASGTSTPTKAAQRRPRAFLDLAPLTGFLTLRGRYGASQKPVVEVTDADSEGESEGAGTSGGQADSEDAEAGDDEDDRRTIRGVRASGAATANGDYDVRECTDGRGEGKMGANENGDVRHGANGGAVNGREKVVNEPMAHAQTSPPFILSS